MFIKKLIFKIEGSIDFALGAETWKE